MNIKRLLRFFVVCLMVCSLCFYFSAWADDEESNIPEWMKRIDYSVTVETDKNPTVYFETVQPLWMSKNEDRVIFAQPRISSNDNRWKYSLGLGMRRLIMSGTVLAGINTFFDYQQLHEHCRGGLGLEAIGKHAEARANYYVGMSSKRLIEDTATTSTYEKAVDGFDIESGAALPYLPWVKLFGSYYWYDYKMFDDREGWKLRAELKPSEFLTVDLYMDDDNKGDIDYGATTAINVRFEDFNIGQMCRSLVFKKEAFPDYDLKTKFLQPVERSFDIEVEKWQESGTIIVEVGRT